MMKPSLTPIIHDAAALMGQTLAPVRYVIPGWLPEGLTLLVANPKAGKSTLVLQAAAAVAGGGVFWGEDVPQARVLMIDLETNSRRLQRKLLNAGTTPPAGWLSIAYEWPRGILGVDAIGNMLDEDPSIRLVIVDTLQRFRSGDSGKNAYSADYETLAPLQELCKRRAGLAILVVHHKRKPKTGGEDEDPINSVNGSAGLTGAADGIWILSRKAGEFHLHIQARDWERDEDDFQLCRRDGRWELNDAPRFTYSEREILSVLDKVGPMSTAQVGDALKITRQAALKRLQRQQALGQVQFREEAWHVVL